MIRSALGGHTDLGRDGSRVVVKRKAVLEDPRLTRLDPAEVIGAGAAAAAALWPRARA